MLSVEMQDNSIPVPKTRRGSLFLERDNLAG